ncbi:unnamed protein product [Schistosoma curassoni]|uniref:Ras-associating domain-containing protein n=1 Tax=Schistosoma curassoni TaxID=6186 RepID=A0A183KKC3_9TREM|nr:unnamed protein product [Schistosoma curassoni]
MIHITEAEIRILDLAGRARQEAGFLRPLDCSYLFYASLILIYTDLAQGTEVTQIYTITSKDTVKDVIKQILARNHLSLKDPNLFYLTYRRQTNNDHHHNNKHIKSKQQGFHSNLYEAMEVNTFNTSGIWSLNQNSKGK